MGDKLQPDPSWERERVFFFLCRQRVCMSESLLEIALIMRSTMVRLLSSTSQSNLDGALTLSKRSIKESCCWVPGADHSSSFFLFFFNSIHSGNRLWQSALIPLEHIWIQFHPCIDAFTTLWIKSNKSITRVRVAVNKSLIISPI